MSRLLIVSNQLPISVTKKKDKPQFETSTGGLNAASGAFYKSQHGLWVGCSTHSLSSLKRRGSHLPGIISILERKTKIYEDSSHLSARLCSPGGVCNHTANLAQKFTQMGHEVRIIALASKAVTTFGELKLSS